MSKAIQIWIDEIKNGCDTFIKRYVQGNLRVEDLLAFKEAVSCLNNLIAVEQELCFLDQVSLFGTAQNANKPNSNGYDVYDNNNKIVAELKGMIPCLQNGNFGSQQKEQIEKDLKGMVVEKTTAQGNIQGFDKYIVVFNGTQTAIDNLLKNSTDFDLTKVNGKDYAQHKVAGEKIEIVYMDKTQDIPQHHYDVDFINF